MKQDLYAMLGVGKYATADDINQGYRKAARAAHPDREGGDEELFKAVGAAYAVLSNPVRRAVYDETGETAEGSTVADEAQNKLLQLFQQYLDTGSSEDPIYGMLNAVNEADKARKQSLPVEEGRLKNLLWANANIKRKDGAADTLFAQALTARIAATRQKLAAIERAGLVFAKMRALLTDYTYTPVPVAAPRHFQQASIIGGAFGTWGGQR